MGRLSRRAFLGSLLVAAPASTLLAQGALSLSERAELLRILELLDLSRGGSVADVGAGSGVWTMGLARAVGIRGRVYATEVRGELVAGLKVLVGHGGLRNVRVVRGSQDDMGLAPRCCDAALVRLVYHAFQKPALMRASLGAALKPGGRVLIVDFQPTAADLSREMGEVGFTHVRTIENWSGQKGLYAALFRRAG